ncbi:MAG: HPr(Ser) kinase/phosphatase [Candidatus Eisenbacteria bacterium]|nr:HPr(Ser) kinase/phosphatase [Candidatus Eisenbacteria bacterium]
MTGLSIREFYEQAGAQAQLRILGKGLSSRQPISVSDLNRPGLALTGFVDNFSWERILIFGQTEVSYLLTLGDEARKRALEHVFQFPIPCVVVSKGLTPPAPLCELADDRQIPVLGSELETTPLIHTVTSFLEETFAPSTSMHASLVDVYGVGLLITGRSAIGKSECALDLVERGARLVADDIVTIRRQRNVLIGSGNEMLRHCMEIRGIGIVDVQSIFGIRSIRARKRVEVEVNLREWDATEDYERLGLEERQTTILDVRIPLVVVPIFPGKNITVIAETIALNYLVKAYGYSPAEHLNENLLQMIRRKKNLEILARDDLE